MKTTKDIIKRILLEQAPPEGEAIVGDGTHNDYYDVGLALRRIVVDPDNGNWIDTDYIDEDSIETSWDLKSAEQMYQKKLYEIKFFDNKGKMNESWDYTDKDEVKFKIAENLIGEIISMLNHSDQMGLDDKLSHEDLNDILSYIYENTEFLFMNDDTSLSEQKHIIKKLLSEYDFKTKRIKTDPKTGSVTWDVIYDFKLEDIYEDLDDIIKKMRRAIEENPNDERLTHIWADAKNLRNRMRRAITKPR
jgi:hypothetical protein